MAEVLTESFCERCGTRYTFEATAPHRRGTGRIRTLTRGVRNFIANDDASFAEAMAAAREDDTRNASSQQLDAFHLTFNFCMTCRQYTCRNCWNSGVGECLSCAPDLSLEVLPAAFPDLAVVGPDTQASTFPESAHPNVAASAWPTSDRRPVPEAARAGAAGPPAAEPIDATELDATAPAAEIELTPEELAAIQSALTRHVGRPDGGPAVAPATGEEPAGLEVSEVPQAPVEAAPIVALPGGGSLEPVTGARVEERRLLQRFRPRRDRATPVGTLTASTGPAEDAVAVEPAEATPAEGAAEPAVAAEPAEATPAVAPATGEEPAGIEVAEVPQAPVEAAPIVALPGGGSPEPAAGARVETRRLLQRFRPRRDRATPVGTLTASTGPAEDAVAVEPAEATPAEGAAEPAVAVEPAEATPAEGAAEPAVAVEPAEATPAEGAAEPAVAVEPAEATPAEGAAEPAVAVEPAEATPAEGAAEPAVAVEPAEATPAEGAAEPAVAVEPAEATPAEGAAEPAVAAEPAEATPEPAAAEVPSEPPPAAAPAFPAPTDHAVQPTWRMVAPDGASPGEPQPAPPAWATPGSVTRRESDAMPSAPWAARVATARPLESVWAASSRDILAAKAPGAGRPVGIQSCVSCGLSLSANARFCRRCGTRQG